MEHVDPEENSGYLCPGFNVHGDPNFTFAHSSGGSGQYPINVYGGNMKLEQSMQIPFTPFVMSYVNSYSSSEARASNRWYPRR